MEESSDDEEEPDLEQLLQVCHPRWGIARSIALLSKAPNLLKHCTSPTSVGHKAPATSKEI